MTTTESGLSHEHWLFGYRGRTIRLKPLKTLYGGPPRVPALFLARALVSDRAIGVAVLDADAEILDGIVLAGNDGQSVISAPGVVRLLAGEGSMPADEESGPSLAVSDETGRLLGSVAVRTSVSVEGRFGLRLASPMPLPVDGRRFELTLVSPTGVSLRLEYWPSVVQRSSQTLIPVIERLLEVVDVILAEVAPSVARPEIEVADPSVEWHIVHRIKDEVNRVNPQRTNPYVNDRLCVAALDRKIGRLVLLETAHPRLQPLVVTTNGTRGLERSSLGFLVGELLRGLPTVTSGNPDCVSVSAVADRRTPFLDGDEVPEPAWADLRHDPALTLHLAAGSDSGQLRATPIEGRPVPPADFDRLALLLALPRPSADDLVVEYWPGPLLGSVVEAVSRIFEALHKLGLAEPIHLVKAGGMRAPVTPEYCHSDVAYQLTQERGDVLLGGRRSRRHGVDSVEPSAVEQPLSETDTALVDQFIQSMLRDVDEQNRVARLVRFFNVTAPQVRTLRNGTAVIALVVAERTLEDALPLMVEGQSVGTGNSEANDMPDQEGYGGIAEPNEPDLPVNVFAEALTAFLRAQVTEHSRARPRTRSRVCNLVWEWVNGHQQRPHQARLTIRARLLSDQGRRRLDELVALVPWLALWVDWEGAYGPLVTLNHTQLIDVLALTRPRTVFGGPKEGSGNLNPGSYQSRVRTLTPADLQSTFLLPKDLKAAFDTDPLALDDLARVCELLYHLPWQARVLVQALGALGSTADILDDILARYVSFRMASIDDVAVLVDAPPRLAPQIVVANASSERRLTVGVCGQISALAEYAAGVPHASQFTTAPMRVPASEAEVVVDGVARVVDLSSRSRLDEPSGADGEDIGLTLFRGRHEQLAQIMGPMRPGLDPGLEMRTPIAVYGPRRVGKTTLVAQACRRAVSEGWLAAYAKIDVSQAGTATTPPDLIRSALGMRIADSMSRKFGVALPRSTDDPVEILDAVDAALGGRTVGLILDEFDSLLAHNSDGILQDLVLRFGSRRWCNIVVLATVQRFYRRASELMRWQLLGCPGDLTWYDGVTYFAQPLLSVEAGERLVPELRSPTVLPFAFREVVQPRLGLRPYFWGQLRKRLENRLLASDGYAIANFETLEDQIDDILAGDPYLESVTASTTGLSPGDCRRLDLFTDDEKRILSAFCEPRRYRLEIADAHDLGSPDALDELLDRAILRQSDFTATVELQMPIFGEYLRRNVAYFERYRA